MASPSLSLSLSLSESLASLAGYTAEIEMFSAAVAKVKRPITLSYSPGGGNSAENGTWVAREQLATMCRSKMATLVWI